MTLSLATSRVDFVGNNSTATFSFNFKIFEEGDLLVSMLDTSNTETTLALTTDYTVSGSGNETGGTITLLAGNLATGNLLTIRRVVDIIQTTDLRNQGQFYPESHEDEFDYLTMIDQQQQEEIDRSVKVAETDTSGLLLPAATTRANKYLAFDNDGNAIAAVSVDTTPVAVSSYVETLLVAVDAPTARTILGFTGVSGTVDAAQIAASAVTTAKILDANVTRSKLALGAIGALTIGSDVTVTGHNIALTDDYVSVDASSGDVVCFLPAASTATGRRYWIKKVDSSAHLAIVRRAGSDTIDGLTDYNLLTQYETIQIVSNGISWAVLAHDYPRITAASVLTFSALGTVSANVSFLRRDGDRAYFQGSCTTGTVTGSTFAINLPTGVIIDITKLPAGTSKNLVGALHRLLSSSTALPGTSSGPFALFSDGAATTQVFMALNVASGLFTKAVGSAFNSSENFTFKFDIPVAGWN